MKIKKITRKAAKCRVYNLEVDGDPTYYANGILVHNCRSVLVPIFAGAEPEEWDQPPDGLEPAEGFGGSVGSRVRPAGSVKHPGYQ